MFPKGIACMVHQYQHPKPPVKVPGEFMGLILHTDESMSIYRKVHAVVRLRKDLGLLSIVGCDDVDLLEDAGTMEQMVAEMEGSDE